jgi:hypothetical protein
MRAIRFGLVLLALGTAAVACGEGRAIFNVDVYSFLAGEMDTVPYGAPPIAGTYDTTTVPLELTLLGGLGDSQVDTVRIDAAANLLNTQGAANVSFELHFAEDSDAVYTGTPHFTAAGAVNGPGTTSIGGTAVLTDSIFSKPTLWVGIRVSVTNPTGTLVTGRLAVNQLDLRIVLDDRVF